MTKWQRVCREVFDERGPLCELCGALSRDAHHALIGRMKSKPELDCKENTLLVCRGCHEDSDEAKRLAWQLLCDRYGREHMVAWLDGLSLIEKPRLEWMER